MKDRDWILVGLLAVAAVVIYNLLQPTTTSASVAALSASGSGQGSGQDLYSDGPYTAETSFVSGGLSQ